MIKQLIRQTIELLRHNVLLNVISILGTAFAICLIMVMVIAWQVKYRGASPETNLERTMFIKSFTIGLTSVLGFITLLGMIVRNVILMYQHAEDKHRMDGILRGIAHRH